MEFIASIINNVVKRVVRRVSPRRPVLPLIRTHPLEDIIVDRQEGMV